MMDYFFLIPVALALGAIALAAFMWSLRSGQYDDLAGAAERILFENRDGPNDTARALGASRVTAASCLDGSQEDEHARPWSSPAA
jgi:cbb3-type cytochrome oxidase maturation protein